jgi:hypothetical protein
MALPPTPRRQADFSGVIHSSGVLATGSPYRERFHAMVVASTTCSDILTRNKRLAGRRFIRQSLSERSSMSVWTPWSPRFRRLTVAWTPQMQSRQIERPEVVVQDDVDWNLTCPARLHQHLKTAVPPAAITSARRRQTAGFRQSEIPFRPLDTSLELCGALREHSTRI